MLTRARCQVEPAAEEVSLTAHLSGALGVLLLLVVWVGGLPECPQKHDGSNTDRAKSPSYEPRHGGGGGGGGWRGGGGEAVAHEAPCACVCPRASERSPETHNVNGTPSTWLLFFFYMGVFSRKLGAGGGEGGV